MIDFLVIGGGIAGLAAGAGLSTLGQVTVLEAEDTLGYHTSGRSAALYEPSYGSKAVEALGHASLAGHQAAGVLSPRGVMLVAKADQRAEFEADTVGMGMAEIDMAKAMDLCPILDPEKVAFAAYNEASYDIDTELLMQTYAKEIRANGGEVLTAQRVQSITKTGETWTVTTSTRTFEAKNIVNAAGSWVDKIAALAGITEVGFQPKRRSMARVPAPDGMNPSAWPMIFGVEESWYMKPDAGALIVSPADATPSEPMDAWADDMDLAEGIARFEAHTTVEVDRMIANWAGLRTFSPDKTLVLGPDPLDPSFIWCAGQGGYGFTTAPAVKDFIRAIVAGTELPIAAEHAAAVLPDRYR